MPQNCTLTNTSEFPLVCQTLPRPKRACLVSNRQRINGAPIVSHVSHLDVVEICLDITVQVDIALQLVQKLTLDRISINDALSVLVLSDDTTPIFVDLRNAEWHIVQLVKRILVEAGEVRACNVCGTLNEMSCHQSSRQSVIVCFGPRIPVPSRCNYLECCR